MDIPYSRLIFGAVPWYSALIALGILAAFWLAGREERRLGLPKDTALDLTLIVVPCGIVGARLYYVAMTWEAFASNPISILYVWQGGIAIYGGVIGGALGAFVYARRKKLPFLRMADILAPGLLLAQAIGRWGNYFNMEAYGPVIQNPAFCFFPAGVRIDEGGVWVWHMAAFFYESVWNLCGFAALWSLRKRRDGVGEVFGWYLLIYGSGRFIIEQLREDSLYLFGFRASQYLSLALCASAAIALARCAYRGRRADFGLAAVCIVLMLVRWMVLENIAAYAALMAAGYALCALLLLRSDVRGYASWLVLPAALDIAGLAVYAAQAPVSGVFVLYLHTLICSLTLPLTVYLLTLPGVKTCRSAQ